MSCEINNLPSNIILWGGTGQAKVMRPVIEHWKSRVVAVFDDTVGLPPPFPDIPLFTGRAALAPWLARQPQPGDIGFCVAIGNPHGRVRLQLADWLADQGLRAVSLAHPRASIAADATIGPGAQIHDGAVVGVAARLGRQVIINTSASVDHECQIDDGAELAPRATLAGLVHVGVNGWICTGACVLPRLAVGNDAVVGAGAVVTRNVAAGVTVVGVPARPLSRKA